MKLKAFSKIFEYFYTNIFNTIYIYIYLVLFIITQNNVSKRITILYHNIIFQILYGFKGIRNFCQLYYRYFYSEKIRFDRIEKNKKNREKRLNETRIY